MTGPVFILAALDGGQVVAVAPAGTPLSLDDPGWMPPRPDLASQLAASWPAVQPAGGFEALPAVTAASVMILLADGKSHRFLIESPDGAAARADRARGSALPDVFALGPEPPLITRAYPWQVAFAFSVPPRSGSRVTYSTPEAAGPPAPPADLALAVMERQAIMNRIRALCAEARTIADGGPCLVWVQDILAALDDPDPLAHP